MDIGIDDVYGSDPLLYNGRYYTFFPPPNTGGNQYLTDRSLKQDLLQSVESHILVLHLTTIYITSSSFAI